jgi:nucleotide-binding universal stress UspA family protein
MPTRVGIRNVLIATDFSQCSTAAFQLGLQLLKRYEATAHIVFVVPDEPYRLAGPEAYVSAKDAALRDLDALRAELKRTHTDLAEDRYRLYLLDGDVAEAILNFACKKGVDLIVMGTHGRGGLRKALLGSVAERVFRHAPVPVMTVGPGAVRRAWGQTPRAILVAADFTAASRRAVQYAARLARQHHARLTLLHVMDPAQLRRVPDRAAVERGIEQRLHELAEGAGVECSVRMAAGRVPQSVVEAAGEEGADLLVLGVRASTGVLDRLVIPHAYEIVCGAPCPVLTLREARTDDV